VTRLTEERYRRFSTPKSRAVDQQFIDLFDLTSVWDEVLSTGGGIENLPEWGMLTIPRRSEISATARDGRRASLAGL
jgi:tyrosine-protein phosphatase SIW14